MKARIAKLVDAISKMIEECKEKSDSKNEKTANKYSDVGGYLEEAKEALGSALDRLEDE